MEQQDKEVLQSLGYNTERKCMRFFNDLILEVEECIDDYSEEEVVELINNKNSFIYVEMKIFYELGLNKMQSELDMIHKTMRNPKNVDIETYTDVFGSNYNPTVEESIFSIANYRKKLKDKGCLNQDVQKNFYVKTLTNTQNHAAM